MTGKITILGSTGSIGVQALEVARENKLEVTGLSANTNIQLLEKQVRQFKPCAVSVRDDMLAFELEKKISDTSTEVYYGMEGLKTVSALSEADTVLNSLVGIAGLIPTLEAVKKGKNIALANKETLVAGGSIVMKASREKQAEIIPVDSEHSAIYQCLNGSFSKDIGKIILTASGGPFRGKKAIELQAVTIEDALNHPNWSMGKKITIDSATLANKGLEVIEARWLFDIKPENIKVVVHPQSIIHSMVEFKDSSVLAQMGMPDMRIPIQYALTKPERPFNGFEKLDILNCGPLTFEEPDMEAFPCLSLAYEALKCGGTMPAFYNGANEVVVELFLEGKIGFMDISEILENVMKRHNPVRSDNLGDVLDSDLQARRMVMEQAGKQS